MRSPIRPIKIIALALPILIGILLLTPIGSATTIINDPMNSATNWNLYAATISGGVMTLSNSGGGSAVTCIPLNSYSFVSNFDCEFDFTPATSNPQIMLSGLNMWTSLNLKGGTGGINQYCFGGGYSATYTQTWVAGQKYHIRWVSTGGGLVLYIDGVHIPVDHWYSRTDGGCRITTWSNGDKIDNFYFANDAGAAPPTQNYTTNWVGVFDNATRVLIPGANISIYNMDNGSWMNFTMPEGKMQVTFNKDTNNNYTIIANKTGYYNESYLYTMRSSQDIVMTLGKIQNYVPYPTLVPIPTAAPIPTVTTNATNPGGSIDPIAYFWYIADLLQSLVTWLMQIPGWLISQISMYIQWIVTNLSLMIQSVMDLGNMIINLIMGIFNGVLVDPTQSYTNTINTTVQMQKDGFNSTFAQPYAYLDQLKGSIDNTTASTTGQNGTATQYATIISSFASIISAIPLKVQALITYALSWMVILTLLNR